MCLWEHIIYVLQLEVHLNVDTINDCFYICLSSPSLNWLEPVKSHSVFLVFSIHVLYRDVMHSPRAPP